jgi:hypothetical protein
MRPAVDESVPHNRTHSDTTDEASVISQLQSQEKERNKITSDMMELVQEMKSIHSDASQKIHNDKEVCSFFTFMFGDYQLEFGIVREISARQFELDDETNIIVDDFTANI